jgi:hypothetical protein
MSYELVSKKLRVLCGIDIPTKTIHRIVRRETDSMIDTIPAEAIQLFDIDAALSDDCKDLKGSGPVYVCADGVILRYHKSKLRFEGKVVTVTNGETEIVNSYAALQERVGYARNMDYDTFGKCAAIVAFKEGYLTASERFFVSDGAEALHSMHDMYFPDSIPLLDMYHLTEAISISFCKQCSEKQKTLRNRMYNACNRYDPHLLLRLINTWEPEPEHAHRKEILQHYVYRNRQEIRNHIYSDMVHGSGWVENAVRLIVSRRLKRPGMGWTKEGSEAMYKLKLLEYNGTWDEYWHERKGLTEKSSITPLLEKRCA